MDYSWKDIRWKVILPGLGLAAVLTVIGRGTNVDSPVDTVGEQVPGTFLEIETAQEVTDENTWAGLYVNDQLFEPGVRRTYQAQGAELSLRYQIKSDRTLHDVVLELDGTRVPVTRSPVPGGHVGAAVLRDTLVQPHEVYFVALYEDGAKTSIQVDIER